MDDLPVDVLHWGVAVAPIAVLLVLLAVRGWAAPKAAPIGLAIGAVAAVTVFRTPLGDLATSIGVGLWDALFVLLVVWPAMLLYHVTNASGALDALRDGIQRFSQNQLFLVMAFGWVFASFLQGVAGFGVPVAVVAPLLVTLGVKPVAAVVISLIGHAWANMFGTLGVAWLAVEQVIEVDDPVTTVVQTAALLWIPNLMAGFTIAWVFGRWDAIRHAWPLVLVISAIHGGGQLAIVGLNPVLSAFLASTAALLALYPLSRWSRYSEPADDIDDRPAIDDDEEMGTEEDAPMSFAWSLLPYAVLSVTAVVALAVTPIQEALETIEFGPRFPTTETDYGVERTTDDSYSPITPLTHPATFLLLATVAAWIAYRSRGFFERQEEITSEPPTIWKSTGADAVPASLAIVGFLVLAKVLDHSGQVEVLAVGVSEIIPAVVFAALANAIGVLGAFMTSSNTSSNLLFADLQQNLADSGDLSEPTILAAQGAGGAIGNAIDPASVVLGTTTAGAQGEEGAVLRRTLPWTAAASIAIGLATLALL